MAGKSNPTCWDLIIDISIERIKKNKRFKSSLSKKRIIVNCH